VAEEIGLTIVGSGSEGYHIEGTDAKSNIVLEAVNVKMPSKDGSSMVSSQGRRVACDIMIATQIRNEKMV